MPLSPDEIAAIGRKIGYVFKDKALLETCFTHASYANAHGTANNERLEFLGDAVLGFLAAEALFEGTEQDEGRMTELRQKMVSEKPLRAVVESAGLDRYLLCGGKDVAGGKAVSSLFEALTAGIYLDGGMEEARRFVQRSLFPYVRQAAAERNDKGDLQEFLQARGEARAVYTVIAQEGAPHMPRFRVEASAMGKRAQGEGKSKAEAEKAAARSLLEKLKR